MAHHGDGVNPLRPYYIPPTIGEPPEPLPTPGPNAFAQGNASGMYASKARDMFSDIDYKEFLAEPSPSVVQTVKEFLDELLWKYTSTLMAQPFEVAKTIMQVRSQDDLGSLAAAGLPVTPAPEEIRQRRPSQQIPVHYETEGSDSDSDLDELAYFGASHHHHHPSTPSPSLRRSQQRPQQPSPLPSPRFPPKPIPAHHLVIRTPDSVLEVIGQLWQKEGAWGVWKGTNATFVYHVLQSLLENWSRSLLSALFNVPDLGWKNDLDRLVDVASPYPWASLCVAATAAVMTGLVLAPLDLVRTRLIITSTARGSRRSLSALRNLPSYFCSSGLVIPTILHSLVHPVLTLSTPLALRSYFMVEKEQSPTAFSIGKFCSSTAALFFKLPLETVLRRGQVAVLSSPQYVQAFEVSQPSKGRRVGGEQLEAIVPLGSYNGLFGTMYTITNEEGSRPVPSPVSRARVPPAKRGKPTISETVYRQGQGLDGLWRGWKVSWWGLVGLWTATVLGDRGDGEF
ncbi:mitochondrial carrier domain-containing protein [Lasiosphaeria miniovina]|uniref:Mitochondrial carrier domain-containing protein n=1 Tax=Lasiosphaeria miniovina TaxID=1954250 RepID=A0AA40B558_9PEZI|nr:mitochondrial carrier domain-containing protein [Lasiosphaeria miniovina]KAK0727827.1 mitochondrial carrier domain-containing protein [Lasiosphaeria miniovina]